MKKVEECSRRFKQVKDGSIKKGALGFQKVLKGSRRFKKVLECSRRFNNRKRVQEGFSH